MSQSSEQKFSVVIKKDCPTCEMIEPVLTELLAHYPGNVSVYVQDDPSFPKSVENKIDDTSLNSLIKTI